MAILIDCVFKNDPAGLRAALDKGAEPNERGRAGRTPLFHAATDNRLEAAKLLLAAGAQVDAQDEGGNSALHQAAQDYHPEMASLLIDKGGAKVDIEDDYGNTPLWRAVFNSENRGELITILLRAGADRNHRNKRGKSPLDLARTIANYDAMQFFK
jgi:ankyrin repeat protein